MTTLVDVFNLLKGRKESVDGSVETMVNPQPVAQPVAPPAQANGTGADQNAQYLKMKQALDEMSPEKMELLRKKLHADKVAKQAAMAAQQKALSAQSVQ